MVYTATCTLDTNFQNHWTDITAMVAAEIDKSGISHGIVTVTSLHTTAGITINENADPDVEHDFFFKLNTLVPRFEEYYLHAEGNSDSHVKSSLVGFSEQRSLQNGKMMLGMWQSIYFCEFDGPRTHRKFSVTIIGE